MGSCSSTPSSSTISPDPSAASNKNNPPPSSNVNSNGNSSKPQSSSPKGSSPPTNNQNGNSNQNSSNSPANNPTSPKASGGPSSSNPSANNPKSPKANDNNTKSPASATTNNNDNSTTQTQTQSTNPTNPSSNKDNANNNNNNNKPSDDSSKDKEKPKDPPKESEKESSSSPTSNSVSTSNTNAIKKQNTEDRFQVVRVLGEGASCKVMAVKSKQNGSMLAMKVMDKSESYNKILFENESLILKSLIHPNILQFVESYEDKKSYHLLTVLCQGGELFDRVKNGSFSEKVASRLTKEILQALSYCHKKNIVHRDLKPENFVFETPEENSPMKLIDFGCAKIAKDEEAVTDVAGSPYYAAPEVLNENFVRTGRVWKASDMWSVGVIVFLLVCGYPPFNGESQEKIFAKIKRGKYRFPQPAALGGIDLSDGVKELITNLLKMNPKERWTAEQSLAHPWVQGEAAPDAPLPNIVVEALSAFRSKCRLKKAVGRVLGHRMTEDDKIRLQEVFKKFDANGDGQLGPEEVAKLMKHIGKDDFDVKNIMENMDEDGDGGVSVNEFQSAIALAKLTNENEIKASFDLFDLDKDGFVSHEEIQKICQFLTPEAADQLIKEVDKNSDGKINFQEWLHAMTDIDNKINRVATQKNIGKASPSKIVEEKEEKKQEEKTN